MKTPTAVRPIYLIYDATASWERDFIQRELLGAYRPVVLEMSSLDLIERHTYADWDDIQGNNVFVFSSNANSCDEVQQIVRFLKPRIVFHLSDGWGTRPRFQHLAREAPLVIRQHHHPSYPSYPNITYMPLGYMSGMLSGASTRLTPPTPDRRALVWSFVGEFKQDRRQMVETMSSLQPNLVSRQPPAEMRRTYLDSVFVPNGRGNVSLNCFRLYEASLCGAIPVVVGTQEELGDTFAHESDPPWIFAQTWDDAADQCRDLYRDEAQLHERHTQVLQWWRTRVTDLRGEIDQTLGSWQKSTDAYG